MLSKLWLPLRRLLAFWLWLVLLALAPAITFAYDCGSQTKQAYDGTIKPVFRYDVASVLVRDENTNQLPGERTFFVAFARFLAAKSRLIGVPSCESSALALQIYGIEVNGQSADSSIEAFGSRAGSTFRRRGPLPTFDLDIIVSLNESAANRAGLAHINAQLGAMGTMFQGVKGFPVRPIVEILGLSSVKPKLLLTP